MKNILILSVIAILFFSFTNSMEKVDYLFYNGRVYSVDKDFGVYESFVIKNGKIVAVGSNKNILSKYESDNKIDLKGKFVYPGFIDAHCHFYSYGLGLKRGNLTGTKSFDEVLEKLKEHNEKFPSEWIIGRGWDQNDWKKKEFPNKEKLDNIFPDKPVFLTRIDGHAVLVNSKALNIAGITKESKINGGFFEIKNQKLTGILIDNAIDIVKDIIPEPELSEKITALKSAANNCFSVGLTTVACAGLPKEIIELYDSLQKSGELKIRIYAMLETNEENFNRFLYKGIYKTNYLNVRSVKMYVDGALGSRGALLFEPYSDDTENIGLMLNDTNYYNEICNLVIKNGYQVNTHAIGDSAIRFILNVYSKHLKGKNDLRWRIEHSQVVHPDDFKMFGKYNIIPSVQTTHATSDMYWAEERLGKKRLKGAYAYKQLMKQNGWIPNGSDFPIEDINPIYGFYAAFSRKDIKGYPENGFQKENALTREESLKAMTIWAAMSLFEENEKGSIETGKFADFVILDKDIMEIKESEVPFVKVLKTFIGGEEVFSVNE
ncbi:MAG: amidohydrolase [Bacteroidales bacterium]|nr:amidohydrolase [Bacteroidales bacterium]